MLSRRALVWVAVLVVVLVVVDVVLVALALARTAPGDAGTPGPVPTFSSTPVPTDTSTPGAAAATPPAAASGRRFLSVVTGLEAWRASQGSCDGPGVALQHTVDGGATWEQVAPADGMVTIEALRASADGVRVLGASGPDCDLSVHASVDGGLTWAAAAPGTAGAGVDGDHLVLQSGASVDAPCADPVQGFQGDHTTAVVCEDELEWRTGTADWTTVPVQGLRSLTVAGSSYTLARTGVAGCDGVRIDTMSAAGVTPASTTTSVGCAAGADVDGPVVLARSGNAVWLWTDDGVLVSTDGGVTW